MLYNIYHKIEFFDFYFYTDTVNNVETTKIFEGKVAIAELASFNSLLIDSDIENLTDTASITIPYSNFSLSGKELSIKDSKGTSTSIKVGNKIKISLGYYRNDEELKLLKSSNSLKPVFIGFISNFNSDNELIEIMCEDYMYLFKQSKVNFSFEANTSALSVVSALVGELNLDSILPVFNQNILDINLGVLRTDGFVTSAKIFQTIADKYGLYIYFKLDSDNEPKLNVGLKYQLITDTILRNALLKSAVKFSYPYTASRYAIINNGLSYEAFDKSTDLAVLGSIQVLEIIRNGVKIQESDIQIDSNGDEEDGIVRSFIVENVGTIDGILAIGGEDDVKTRDGKEVSDIAKRPFVININVPSIDEDAMQDLVKNTWNNHVGEGFTGSFTTFGLPRININDIVNLTIDDGRLTANKGNYYIDSVVTKINSNAGFIQELTIGSQID